MTRKQAVALRYLAQQDAAPKVVAKGSGLVAEKLIQTAAASNVPIHKDEGLAQALMALELEQVIPADLYQVVAEVLAAIYRAERA